MHSTNKCLRVAQVCLELQVSHEYSQAASPPKPPPRATHPAHERTIWLPLHVRSAYPSTYKRNESASAPTDHVSCHLTIRRLPAIAMDLSRRHPRSAARAHNHDRITATTCPQSYPGAYRSHPR